MIERTENFKQDSQQRGRCGAAQRSKEVRLLFSSLLNLRCLLCSLARLFVLRTSFRCQNEEEPRIGRSERPTGRPVSERRRNRASDRRTDEPKTEPVRHSSVSNCGAVLRRGAPSARLLASLGSQRRKRRGPLCQEACFPSRSLARLPPCPSVPPSIHPSIHPMLPSF